MINAFEAEFINVKTGEKKTVVFDSTKGFIDAWEDAISFFNTVLLKLDKTWIYSKVELI